MKKNLPIKFKISLFSLLVIIFTISFISCKEAPAVVEQQQEEEKGEVTIPSKTKETQETTPETTTEVEKVDAPEIEGLKFDQKTKTYIAEENNPYGLEAGVEAGVYVNDAVEINGKIEDSIGFKAKFIEYIQNKIIQETGEYYFPILTNLKETEGAKMTDLTITEGADKGLKVIAMNLPVGTVFHVPYSGEWTFYYIEKSWYSTNNQAADFWFNVWFDIGEMNFMGGVMVYSSRDGEVLANMEKIDDIIYGETGEDLGDEKRAEMKLGDSLGKILMQTPLNCTKNKEYHVFDKPGDYQLCIYLIGRDRTIGGVDRLIEIGEGVNKHKVFILPDFQETAHEQNN